MSVIGYWQVRMDGSDGRTDLRMCMPRDTGVFVRSTAKPDGSMLLMGARSRASSGPGWSSHHATRNLPLLTAHARGAP